MNLLIPSQKKKTRKRVFLKRMNNVIPWDKVEGLLSRNWQESQRGRKRADKMKLFRIYLLQQWYNMSDQQAEEEVFDHLAYKDFVGLGLPDGTYDETTICRFRHFLEEHSIPEQFFALVNEILISKGLIVKDGTSVDATLIAAPSSTKNKDKKRDPEMSSTKKGNTFHFGMKLHIGADCHNGLIHTVQTTTAKVHDSAVFEDLLHGEELAVFGDKGYANQVVKKVCRILGVFYGIQEKAVRGKKLSSKQKKRNRKLSSIRSFVEHPFHTIKCIFCYKKVRYKGLTKNTHQLFSLCALTNLYRARKKLIPVPI